MTTFQTRSLYIALSITALTACNGDSKSKDNPAHQPPRSSTISPNIIKSVGAFSAETIDLTKYVTGSTEQATIGRLTKVSGECDATTNIMQVELTTDEGLCEFQYSITDIVANDIQESQPASLIIASATGPEFPSETIESVAGQTQQVKSPSGVFDQITTLGDVVVNKTDPTTLEVVTEHAGHGRIAYTTIEQDGTTGTGQYVVVTSETESAPIAFDYPEETYYIGQDVNFNITGYTDAEQIIDAWYGDTQLRVDHTTPLEVNFQAQKDKTLQLILSDHRGGVALITPNAYVPKGLDIIETGEEWWSLPPTNEDIHKFYSVHFTKCFPEGWHPNGYNEISLYANHLPDYDNACLYVNTDSEGNLIQDVDYHWTNSQKYCDELNDVLPPPGKPWTMYQSNKDGESATARLMSQLEKGNLNVIYPYRDNKNENIRINGGLCYKEVHGGSTCGGSNKKVRWFGTVNYDYVQGQVNGDIHTKALNYDMTTKKVTKPAEGWYTIWDVSDHGRFFDQTIFPMCISRKT